VPGDCASVPAREAARADNSRILTNGPWSRRAVAILAVKSYRGEGAEMAG